MSFKKLNLIEPILKALNSEGYTMPTPIQERAIPLILEGKDVLGCAQTGTGKTAAFAIPVLQTLHNNENKTNGKKAVKALILSPTRELAVQIGESFSAYGKHTSLKHAVIFGGVSQKIQTDALRRGVDILIATPGRLLDLINQRYISLREVEMFILDEADRMLDMGFIHDIKRILTTLPAKRQSLFFSATMPGEILKLAGTILVDPAKVEVTPVSSTTDAVKQSVYFVNKSNKKSLLLEVLADEAIASALVFTRTKHGADRIARDLKRAGMKTEAIHGDKSQGARQRALNNFKLRKTRILIATDIAARGIDVDDLSHVINYELPNQAETYVHRIGRTGRAGASGIALSFCDADEKTYLKDIRKLISGSIAEVKDHTFAAEYTDVPTGKAGKKPQGRFQESRNGKKRVRKNWSKNYSNR